MKKTLKCFVSLLASVFIFSFSLVPSFPLTVSALSSDGIIYSAEDINISFDSMKSCLSRLYDNPSLSNVNLSSSVIYIHFFNSSSVRVVILPNYTTVKSSTSYGNFTYYFPFTSSYAFIPFYGDDISISSLSTYNFVLRSTPFEYSFIGINDNYSNVSNDGSTLCGFTAYSYQSNFNGSLPADYYSYISSNFVCSLPKPFNPVISPLYESTYSLAIQKDKFVEWLLSTGRYVEIAESLASNRVSSFVDIFSDYGGNNRAFITNIKKFFQFIGISQTVSDYNAVLTKTQSLYREFQNYIRQLLIDKYNDRTQNTSDIKPYTNSDNTSLITNSEDDTVVVLILRDILRSLIALPNNISNLIDSFEIKVEGLENTVNVVNQSGIPNISSLWTYNESDFDTDLENFANDVSNVQRLPVSYLTNINNNPLMPERMLSDKEELTVNIPNISGFTVSDNGKSFSTQTTSYTVSSNNYPWLDPLVKKIKRFSGILLILGYLVHLRYKIPDIVRGE